MWRIALELLFFHKCYLELLKVPYRNFGGLLVPVLGGWATQLVLMVPRRRIDIIQESV